MSRLLSIIVSEDDAERNCSLESVCRDATLDELIAEVEGLDRFRRTAENLYQRVRALFFLSAIYRYHIPPKLPSDDSGLIPFAGYQHLLSRRFNEAIDALLAEQTRTRVTDALASALAESYHQLGFQTLADQVRRSVRSFRRGCFPYCASRQR